MTLAQLQAIIDANNKPELAEIDGMVYQVWQDGEITLQKSGSILWQRTLHCHCPGKNGFRVLGLKWGGQLNSYDYIFTDNEGAEAVRDALFNYIQEPLS